MLRFLQKRSLPTPLLLKHLTTSTSPPPQAPSLTVHFLQNSCSLSPSLALSLSKRIHLKSTKKPHAVLSLLKSHSFSSSDISSLILRLPKLLLSDPQKTLLPKLSFFLSLNLSSADLVRLLLSHPSLLLSSLPNRLLPNLSLLLSLLPSNLTPRHALLSFPSSLCADLSSLLPKLNSLTARGVPASFALKLLATRPRSLSAPISRVEEALAILKDQFLIDPAAPIFPHAYGVLAKLPRSDWDKKMELLKTMGWTEGLVVSAFKKHPYFMAASIGKLERNMGFFVEEFGWDAEYVAKYPVVLSLSYEKRIVPRSRVMRVLGEEGLFEGRVAARQLMLGKEEFLRRYVSKFEDRVPRVVDAIEWKVV